MYAKSKVFNESNIFTVIGITGYWFIDKKNDIYFIDKDFIGGKIEEFIFNSTIKPKTCRLATEKEVKEIFRKNLSDVFNRQISVVDFQGKEYFNIFRIETNHDIIQVKYGTVTDILKVHDVVLGGCFKYNQSAVRCDYRPFAMAYLSGDGYWSTQYIPNDGIEKLFKEIM